MTLLVLVFLVIAAASLAHALLGRLDAADIAMAFALPTLVGFLILLQQERVSARSTFTFLVFWLAFLMGAALGRRRRSTARSWANSAPRPVPLGLAQAASGIAIVGTAYHFAVGGIPLLQAQVDVSRFDVSGSGLLGIPGRMYLFGLPLALLLSATDAADRAVPLSKDRVFRWTLAAFVASRVLSGFKGGLIEVAIVLLLVGFSLGREVRLRRYLGRFAVAGMVSLLFVLGIGSLYTSYTSSGRGISEILLDRVTIVAAEPAAAVLDRRLVTQLTDPLANDLAYYLKEYGRVGEGRPFALDRLVSGSLLGVSPEVSYFLPPVTVSSMAEVEYETNAYAATVVSFLLGALCARLSRPTNRRPAGVMGVGKAYGCLFLILTLQKGGLVYHTLNMSIVALLLIGSALVVNGLLSHRHVDQLLQREDF